MSHNSTDIFVVDDFDEANQFRYVHNNQPVEVGTAVGYDRPLPGMPGESPPDGGWPSYRKNKAPVWQLVCFDDIYYTDDE